jgi:hypothetical protein
MEVLGYLFGHLYEAQMRTGDEVTY